MVRFPPHHVGYNVRCGTWKINKWIMHTHFLFHRPFPRYFKNWFEKPSSYPLSVMRMSNIQMSICYGTTSAVATKIEIMLAPTLKYPVALKTISTTSNRDVLRVDSRRSIKNGLVYTLHSLLEECLTDYMRRVSAAWLMGSLYMTRHRIRRQSCYYIT